VIQLTDREIFLNVHRICVLNNYLTYADMAAIINKSESFIKQVASGRAGFNLDHLRMLAEELECDIKDFFIKEQKGE
jgi:ribosome-binding protein aMBF1 (putative translation factor)